MRHPGIDGHVREHTRAVEKTGLRRQEQQGGLGDQSRDDEDGAAEMPRSEQAPEEHGVHRLAGDWARVGQQIAEHDPAGGEGQREGHEKHRPLSCLHARLTQNRDAVRDRFDTGVGAAAERIRAQKEKRDGQAAGASNRSVKVERSVAKNSGETAEVRGHAIQNRERMRDNK